MSEYDLVVIGGGPAGQKAAIQAGKLGKRVCLIDEGLRPGGTSVHTGTVPSKTLQETSRFLRRVALEARRGLKLAIPTDLSMQELLSRNTLVIKREEHLAEVQLNRNSVELFCGRGRLESDRSVIIETKDGSQIVKTHYIVLATGSRPRRPEGIPFEKDCIYDSDSVMDLAKLPKTLSIVGAGIIGCEYATIFANLGVKVSLFDMADRVLPFADHSISETLKESMEQMGIELYLGDTVEGYRRTDLGVELTTQTGKKIPAEQTLICKGRTANTENLGIDSLGIEKDSRGYIVVNESYQTNIPSIYAAGDVIGYPSLSSTGMYQGMVISRLLFLGEKPMFDKTQMPLAIWTVPETAMVGPTEEELKKGGIEYGFGISDFKENTRSQITGETRGILKLIFELKSRRLLSVHIVSERATELLALGQAVVNLGGTVDYFVKQIFNYPTLSGVYKSAALDAMNRYNLGMIV